MIDPCTLTIVIRYIDDDFEGGYSVLSSIQEIWLCDDPKLNTNKIIIESKEYFKLNRCQKIIVDDYIANNLHTISLVDMDKLIISGNIFGLQSNTAYNNSRKATKQFYMNINDKHNKRKRI